MKKIIASLLLISTLTFQAGWLDWFNQKKESWFNQIKRSYELASLREIRDHVKPTKNQLEDRLNKQIFGLKNILKNTDDMDYKKLIHRHPLKDIYNPSNVYGYIRWISTNSESSFCDSYSESTFELIKNNKTEYFHIQKINYK